MQRSPPSEVSCFRIAIVDDDALVLAALARRLRGHEVTTVTRAVELVEMIRAGREFDAIVSDMMMPEMTGADLYDAIHELAPCLAVRVIFITGGTTTAATSAFLRNTSQPVLMKPLDHEAFLAAIERVARESPPTT